MILLIEPKSSGHHISLYLKSIIHELQSQKKDFEIMTTYESYESESFQEIELINVKIHLFKSPNIDKKNKVLNQFSWYWSIKNHFHVINKHQKYDLVYCNSLDLIDKAIILLGSPFNKNNYCGLILKMGWLRSNRLSRKIIKYLFFILYELWFVDKYLKTIFFIDPKNLSHFRFTKKLKYVNDAVELNFNNPSSFKNTSDKKILLLYGAISKRKGLSILENSLLDSNIKRKLKIVIAGSVEECYQKEFDRIYHRFKANNWDIEIYNKWITKEEEINLFTNTDIVWLCYEKSFNGSSGVLYIAGSYKKPILVNNSGLMSEIVLNNNNGCIADSNELLSIKKNIEKLIDDDDLRNKYGKNGYVLSKKHDSKIFAKTIVNEFFK